MKTADWMMPHLTWVPLRKKTKLWLGITSMLIFLACTTPRPETYTPANIPFEEERGNLRVMFYNVENLFDTIDNPDKLDDDFLPDGEYRWNGYRYVRKLKKIYQVVTAVGGWELPELVGFCEVENQDVLQDLLRFTPLHQGEYGIVHRDGKDVRGIDVALLYQKSAFTLLDTQFIQVTLNYSRPHTRDILWASGLTARGDTLHVFVNHWPSRYGGEERSAWKRMHVASVLRNVVDSLMQSTRNPNILIMGDLNDNPDSKSVREVLGVLPDTSIQADRLYNLMEWPRKVGIPGTIKYKRDWFLFDQIIVSGAIVSGTHGLHVKSGKAMIFCEDFLLADDEVNYGKKLFRTYLGPRYLGGFSDHLPVYVDLFFP